MSQNRKMWYTTLDKICRPVLEALSQRELAQRMPIKARREHGEEYALLEALGRTLVGIAPWLESEPIDPEEKKLVVEYRALALAAIDAGTDPESPDYMNFTFQYEAQPIVDAAFLAHALLRAPVQLLGKMPERVKNNVIAAFTALRYGGKPGKNNWLLFSAMIETALYKLGAPWDRMRVDYALEMTETWYVGDGLYSDGEDFHFDYYNSFVIQPMYIDILRTVGHFYPRWDQLRKPALLRGKRYAAILERLIATDGSFPVTGRSLCYRAGAFQSLSHLTLLEELPEELSYGSVRSALSAVIARTLEAPGTFDEEGWLTFGLAGNQPSLAEHYLTIGSLYLCTAVFLPLGLAETHEFWTAPETPWTSKKVWGGEDFPADTALRLT